MTNVLDFVDFFSNIEVQFLYHGSGPLEKSDMYSNEWDFKYFNGLSSKEFDQAIRDFSFEIGRIEGELFENIDVVTSRYTPVVIALALFKAEILTNKISKRRRIVQPDPDPVWYFKDQGILKVACRFSEEKEEYKSYENFPSLIDFVEELISGDIHWIKQCLDKLIPILKALMATSIRPAATIVKVEPVTSVTNLAKDIKVKPRKEIRDVYAGPKNFSSPMLHKDAVIVLFDKLVEAGHIKNIQGQKNRFQELFSDRVLTKWINPKIDWIGHQTELRGLIHYIDKKFEIANIGKSKWVIADNSFTVNGGQIHLRKDTSNGKYGAASVQKVIQRAMELAIMETPPSED